MHTIRIKSDIQGRVRLTSRYFTHSNLPSLEKILSTLSCSLRLNTSCHSLVIVYDYRFTTLEKILFVLHQHASLSLLVPEVKEEGYCVTCKSCSSCDVAHATPKRWKEKLITFGVLSGYALYLVVKETLLSVAVVSTPFSLTAAIAFFAALPLLKEAWDDVKNKRFSLKTFMGFSLLGAIFGGEAVAAFEIIYILRGGMLLEEYTAERSKKEIHNLLCLDVKKVYILIDDVEMEVDLDAVSIGDIVVSRSGEKIPVDGVIVEGKAEIDEATINGRSEPAFKQIGDDVYANTIVHKGRIYIKVSATGAQTYLARIISKVENSLLEKSPSELAADRLAAKLLKLGTVLTAATYLLTGSFTRAFSVMIVMSCPCATVLAASTAISAGIARGAKQGILIKGGEYLEKVAQSEVFCFDKTGTLTTGKPVIVDMHLSPHVSEEMLFEYAMLAEYRNTHPIARSIVEKGRTLGFTCKEDEHAEILPGLGVKLHAEWAMVLVGNKTLLRHHKLSIKPFESFAKEHLEKGRTIVYVSLDQKILGAFAFEHEVRAGTKEMLEGLVERGVKHLVLLSGDEEKVAHAFAQEYGFNEVYANVMPEGKADVIDALKTKYQNVVMVGDGINDTIAMSRADVAISFASGGSEAAIEISNIAVTKSDPMDILNLYDLSQKSLHVISQNYWLGTGTNLAGVGLAGLGLLSPIAAGAIHIGHTVGIMANSSRLAFKK